MLLLLSRVLRMRLVNERTWREPGAHTSMHNMPHTPSAGWPLRSGLVLIVVSFMALSLAVTATGTARFAVALGYPATIGYVVGAVFDVAKAVLPVALLMLLARRAVMSFALIGVAWLGLVTYSSLATHATVGMAIASIERTGTWKMEGRGNASVELGTVEQRLAALVDPKMPRPSTTVREALAGEKVPPGVWRRSQECLNIRRSAYFHKACAKVLKLRRELAAAEDYEQLDARAKELRERLAAAPLVATTDPLPKAFTATIGRLLPLDGRVGVALLLTIVIEIMSCCGFAGLRALRGPGAAREDRREGPVLLPEALASNNIKVGGADSLKTGKMVPSSASKVLPNSTPKGRTRGHARACREDRASSKRVSSNVLPLRGRATRARAGEGGSVAGPVTPRRNPPLDAISHVSAFVADRFVQTHGASLAAADLRIAYEAWCEANNHPPVSQQKLSAALLRLGFSKWKSCGLIRYRDLRLAA